MSRWKTLGLFGSLVTLGFSFGAFGAEPVPAASPSPVPGLSADYAVGFVRKPRFAGEFHRSMGSKVAQKRGGTGAGLALLLPIGDGSGFDLGVRYAYVSEDEDRLPSGPSTAFTILTFVFDYFVWPEKLGGLFVGGEIGVTDPAASDFFSVYSDYVYIGKIGYEYSVPNSRWSAAFEVRRAVRDPNPLKADRETVRYSDSIALGARYRFL